MAAEFAAAVELKAEGVLSSAVELDAPA